MTFTSEELAVVLATCSRIESLLERVGSILGIAASAAEGEHRSRSLIGEVSLGSSEEVALLQVTQEASLPKHRLASSPQEPQKASEVTSLTPSQNHLLARVKARACGLGTTPSIPSDTSLSGGFLLPASGAEGRQVGTDRVELGGGVVSPS